MSSSLVVFLKGRVLSSGVEDRGGRGGCWGRGIGEWDWGGEGRGIETGVRNGEMVRDFRDRSFPLPSPQISCLD